MAEKPKSKRFKDLEGQRFGFLTVKSFSCIRKSRTYWNVTCDCGTEKEVGARHLMDGSLHSCGCKRDEMARKQNTTHGEGTKTKESSEFRSWTAMRSRCNDPNNASVHGVATKDIAMKNRRDSQLPCNTLLYGSLFSGIGGIDLGFDRAGMQCAWQVEIDPYCQRVLHKHWPEVPKHDDIRTFEPTPVDVVVGGFPCQDISQAGNREGIKGKRSGLWDQYARIICEIRPRFVVVENVESLRFKGRGLHRVLGDLADCGYDAEWCCVPAGAFGAPHIRERLFLVGYADGPPPDIFSTASSPRNTVGESDWWAVEPRVGRVVNGVPDRVDRLRGCGNAVVPQVAEWIGRRLMEFTV